VCSGSRSPTKPHAPWRAPLTQQRGVEHQGRRQHGGSCRRSCFDGVFDAIRPRAPILAPPSPFAPLSSPPAPARGEAPQSPSPPRLYRSEGRQRHVHEPSARPLPPAVAPRRPSVLGGDAADCGCGGGEDTVRMVWPQPLASARSSLSPMALAARPLPNSSSVGSPRAVLLWPHRAPPPPHPTRTDQTLGGRGGRGSPAAATGAHPRRLWGATAAAAAAAMVAASSAASPPSATLTRL